jgi:hypothetical protein
MIDIQISYFQHIPSKEEVCPPWENGQVHGNQFIVPMLL